jgi:hypothetical protein
VSSPQPAALRARRLSFTHRDARADPRADARSPTLGPLDFDVEPGWWWRSAAARVRASRRCCAWSPVRPGPRAAGCRWTARTPCCCHQRRPDILVGEALERCRLTDVADVAGVRVGPAAPDRAPCGDHHQGARQPAAHPARRPRVTRRPRRRPGRAPRRGRGHDARGGARPAVAAGLASRLLLLRDGSMCAAPEAATGRASTDPASA